ncbi:uncharacterized protein HD556DRAFT_1437964 [Suillus plorans]|uniref:KOW domain-containing protein n=1 Tax=Suillus plorans TaxID=116603 RepID=A0A9P7DTN6_9AGAM|nr:uncharacterized protein HD556DRAFT_1437964 [Suillus plorans]KAG1802905.1 hypothetical protein HD556DRAFT_1437964 [Suillus plorans]
MNTDLAPSWFSFHYNYLDTTYRRLKTLRERLNITTETMSKRAASNDDAPTPKRIRIDDGNQTPLADKWAWAILEQFLTTDMTQLSSVHVQSSRRVAKLKNPYLDLAAEEEEEEEEEDDDNCDHSGPSELWKVTSLPGSSSAARFAAAINDITNRFEATQPSSSQDRQTIPSSISDLIHSRSPAGLQDGRMYLLHAQHKSFYRCHVVLHSSMIGNVTDYIAARLWMKNFVVKVSAWIPGQLYVVADSPKTITNSLTSSLYLAVKQYVLISDEERETVERSCSKLPNPAWVRIKHGKYKGDIAQVFDSDLLNDLVAVLIPPRDFPYPMPRGSWSLLDRSRLPNGDAVSNINHSEEVVGCKYKGEIYYKGLLLHNFHRDRLERVVCPHADDIQLHLQSGWDQSFLKSTVVAFSMQFLHVGDWAKIVKGDLSSEIGKVASTDHPAGSATLDLSLDGHRKEIEVRLQDIERVFRVGDTVRVVAGPYLGVEGHIIEMVNDIFRLCQDVSKEEVEVSKYYLDCRHLSHMLHAQLPAQQLFKPPPDIESIQIGDCIEVLVGEHMGKCGIWTHLPHLQTLQYTKDKGYDVKPGDVVRVARGLEYQTKGIVRSVNFPHARLTLLSDIDHSLVDVPISFVIKVCNANLDSFKKEIGQEVFIIGGDCKGYRATLYSLASENCTVAVHGQQRTTLQLQNVATRYGMRLNSAMLEGIDMLSFCEMRGRSYLAPKLRSVTPPPKKVPSTSSVAVADPGASSSWTTWTARPEDQAGNPLPSVNPTCLAAKPDAWTVDADDVLDSFDSRTEKLKEGPLAWLMKKEFSSKFTTHHVMLKVSPSFMGGRLHNRFMSMACPDPFLGLNGPTPEGCVAVFCSSNGAGAAIQHYHIPVTDLSPAPPRKKNQLCIVLDGSHHGSISTIVKCNLKKNTVDIAVAPSTFINLRFDQICLIEKSRATM